MTCLSGDVLSAHGETSVGGGFGEWALTRRSPGTASGQSFCCPRWWHLANSCEKTEKNMHINHSSKSDTVDQWTANVVVNRQLLILVSRIVPSLVPRLSPSCPERIPVPAQANHNSTSHRNPVAEGKLGRYGGIGDDV